MSISGQPQQGLGASAPNAPKDHFHDLADAASATLSDAASQGNEQFENLREQATDQIDLLVEGAQSAASALEGKDSLGISQYLGQLATGLGAFADRVRDKSAEDLLHEGARLARDNPALFVAGSVAIGFGLSRFLRASAPHADESGAASTSASRHLNAPATKPEGATTAPTLSPTIETGALSTPVGTDPLDRTARGFD